MLQITWIDGHGTVMSHGVENIITNLPDGRRFTVKSILKLTPKREHHNTTFTCQAQNTAERTHRIAHIKLEVSMTSFKQFLYIYTRCFILSSYKTKKKLSGEWLEICETTKIIKKAKNF